MKVYISGAITNNPHYKEQFAEAEAKLTAEGLAVLNPCKNEGFTYREYINMGLCELMHCDAIYMLEGWENSTGAKLEYEYAVAVGLEVLGCKPEAKPFIMADYENGLIEARETPEYEIGEDAFVIFGTGMTPLKPITYADNTPYIQVCSESIYMCVKAGNNKAFKLHMTKEQAKAIIKALKIQMKRLGR